MILRAVETKIGALAQDPWIHQRRVRVKAAGRLGLLPLSTVAIRSAQEATADYNAMTLTIAVAYGGREEIADAVCDLIEAGLTRRIDVGMADEQHAFFEAAGVGVDADLFPIGEEVKRRRFEGVGRAIRLALLHRQSSVELLFDRPLFAAYQSSFRGSEPLKRRRRRFRGAKNQVRLRCSIVVIANGPYYGGNFNVCPGAILDDGLFSIGVYRDFSKLELLRHFWSISGGHRHYNPKMEMFNANRVEISSGQRLSVHVDGHPIGTTPVRFEVRPKALKVITA